MIKQHLHNTKMALFTITLEIDSVCFIKHKLIFNDSPISDFATMEKSIQINFLNVDMIWESSDFLFF